VTTLDAGGKRCRNTKLLQKVNRMPALLMKVLYLEEGGKHCMHIQSCHERGLD
jgi:hypothetical protein